MFVHRCSSTDHGMRRRADRKTAEDHRLAPDHQPQERDRSGRYVLFHGHPCRRTGHHCQKGQLFYSNKGPEGTLVDREQLKKNLEAFAQTLQDQRAKVRMMTDSLKNMGENAQKMKFLIDNLQREIDKKDQIIRRLQEELQKKNANIADLRNKLEEISAINTKLTTKVREQEDKLYAGFVLMGEKKNLKEGGFISGGGLTKTKVNVSTMDKSFFTKVDIREFTELEIPSKSPKLIFSAPKKSYKLQKGKEGSLLTIIDPEEFWKNSRYLVIQL